MVRRLWSTGRPDAAERGEGCTWASITDMWAGTGRGLLLLSPPPSDGVARFSSQMRPGTRVWRGNGTLLPRQPAAAPGVRAPPPLPLGAAGRTLASTAPADRRGPAARGETSRRTEPERESRQQGGDPPGARGAEVCASGRCQATSAGCRRRAMVPPVAARAGEAEVSQCRPAGVRPAFAAGRIQRSFTTG
jgi:hypothetical protein